MNASFLKSILLGDEGSYNIFGIQVKFKNELPAHYPSISLEGAGLISKVAFKCLNNNVLRWITQGYAHVFIHEISHALAYKLVTRKNATVHVIKSLCEGGMTPPPELVTVADWENTIINIAGPIGNIAFSNCKLIAATALKNYLSRPIALALGSGGVIWITGELLYAYISASNRDEGDFGKIARCGNIHLALASTALVSQAALGIFAAIKLAA